MTASIVSTVCGAALTVLLALSGRPLRGTTLVGPWLWGIISAAILTLVSLAAMPLLSDNFALSALLTYAAEASTLCPLVALLGARRPQHSAWQFVVATLYAILLVPAVQGGEAGGWIVIDAPWSWFMLGLIGVGLLNFLQTRYWPAAVSLALAQLTLLAPHLLTSHAPTWASQPTHLAIGLALLIFGVVLLRRCAVAPLQTPAWRRRDPLDRLWLDFRDAYGVLWALRVQQRVNAAATQFGWPVELTWDGFHDQLTHQPAEVRAGVEHVMRTVLWRFMSGPWMERLLSDQPEAK